MKQNIHCVHNIVHFHHRFHFRAQKRRRMSVECMKGKLGELSRRMITKERKRETNLNLPNASTVNVIQLKEG